MTSQKKQTWTVREVLTWTEGRFQRAGLDTPRLDAELLLADVLDGRRLDLYLSLERVLSTEERTAYREQIQKRLDRIPVAYLTGRKEFMSMEFRVRTGVFIPRPETELLVELASDLLPPGPRRVADVCTGTGCIACALAAHRPETDVVALEASKTARSVARENVSEHDLEKRITLVAGDDPGLLTEHGPFDAVLSNPPYVPADADVAPEVLHEPKEAVFGPGSDGLDFVRRLIRAAPDLLKPEGFLAIEIGSGQAPAVETLLREQGASRTERKKDLADIERVVLAWFA